MRARDVILDMSIENIEKIEEAAIESIGLCGENVTGGRAGFEGSRGTEVVGL
jgi:hypothetical protein